MIVLSLCLPPVPKPAGRLRCVHSATAPLTAGLQKVYKVPTTDSEILQATVDKDGLSITVVGHADEFNRCAQASLECYPPTWCNSAAVVSPCLSSSPLIRHHAAKPHRWVEIMPTPSCVHM